MKDIYPIKLAQKLDQCNHLMSHV